MVVEEIKRPRELGILKSENPPENLEDVPFTTFTTDDKNCHGDQGTSIINYLFSVKPGLKVQYAFKDLGYIIMDLFSNYYKQSGYNYLLGGNLRVSAGVIWTPTSYQMVHRTQQARWAANKDNALSAWCGVQKSSPFASVGTMLKSRPSPSSPTALAEASVIPSQSNFSLSKPVSLIAHRCCSQEHLQARLPKHESVTVCFLRTPPYIIQQYIVLINLCWNPCPQFVRFFTASLVWPVDLTPQFADT